MSEQINAATIPLMPPITQKIFSDYLHSAFTTPKIDNTLANIASFKIDIVNVYRNAKKGTGPDDIPLNMTKRGLKEGADEIFIDSRDFFKR